MKSLVNQRHRRISGVTLDQFLNFDDHITAIMEPVNVWVHVVNGRVFARSNTYTFQEGIHDSTNFIFGICYMELVMESI